MSGKLLRVTTTPMKKKGIHFKDEPALFEHIMGKHTGNIQVILREYWKEEKRDMSLSAVVTDISGKRVHAIGEMHGSPLPIHFTHDVFFPEMNKSWAILVEGLDSDMNMKNMKAYSIFHGYYIELSAILEIPIGNAVSNIEDPGVRSEIAGLAKINSKDVDVVLARDTISKYKVEERGALIKTLNMMPITDEEKIAANRILIDIERELGLDRDGTCEVAYRAIESLSWSEGKSDEIWEKFMNGWNLHSRLEMDMLLSSYPHIRNVLMVVGMDHLPMLNP